MKKFLFLISVLSLSISCAPKQAKVEKYLENGVEVVINHLQPYKIKGEPSNLILQQELVIDLEREDIAKTGLTEIAGFDIDSEGNIYFWQQGSSKDFIFKFDSKGGFIASFGRAGQGPGEFQMPACLAIDSHDEISIIDALKSKLLTFSKNGNFIKETLLSVYDVSVYPLEDGDTLLWKRLRGPAFEKSQNLYLLCDSRFNEIKELKRDEFPNPSKADRINAINSFSGSFVSPKRIYIPVSGRDYEIWVYDLDGNLIRKIRKEYKPIDIGEDYKQRFLKIRVGPGPEALRNKFNFPKHFPPYQDGFADDEDRLFVMTYEQGKNPKEFLYDIFSRDGIFICRTELANYGQYDGIIGPLSAKVKKNRLYYLREKESGYKELAVYKMRWE